ncbi:hypothetical protein [Streptomyces sp. NPDC056291]|uniref:hypothetical protein n=1 Tax=Streptomyces sp. NPDC056291 TaxID=3345772 RepID=UPI0035D95115
MDARPGPPPEGALIKAGLKLRRLSARKAAEQAGMSDARWRQITSGYQSVSGSRIPVRAPAETLARMALVAGVTPDQLTGAGRGDAAEILREIAETPSEPGSPYTDDPHIDAIAKLFTTLPPEAQDEVLRRVGRSVSPPTAPDRMDVRRHRSAG